MSVRSFGLSFACEAVNQAGAGKSAIDRILDAGVYAPLGFLLTRDTVHHDAVDAGRKQVAFAQSLGRAALKGFARGAKPSVTETLPGAAQAAVAEVPGYDVMTARNIVSLLATASAAEAQWIQDHELAGKQRVTVLRAATSALS